MKTKTTLTLMGMAAGLCLAMPASANDLTQQSQTVTPGSTVSSEHVATLNTCLTADEGTSKAIRACSKSIRLVAPSYDLKSDIYTRRGLLQLSAGRYDRAGKDFESAAKLNGENEFAWLGQGYAAMLSQDYNTALSLFSDCEGHKKAAPLARYGKAMTLEMLGKKSEAIAAYREAAEAKPGWDAPREELSRLGAL